MGARGPRATTGTTPAYNMRLPLALRDRLEKSAAENGQPLAKEIIERLQGSLTGDREIAKQFGNVQNYRVLQAINFGIQAAAARFPEKDWLNDPDTFDFVASAALSTLMQLHPDVNSRDNVKSHIRDTREYMELRQLSKDVWRPITTADQDLLSPHHNIRRDLRDLVERPMIKRDEFIQEFEARRDERLDALRSQAGLPEQRSLDWPPEQQERWLITLHAARQQAAREVELEMKAEGKEIQLLDDDRW